MKSPPPSPFAVVMTLRLWQEQLDVEQCVCSQNANEQSEWRCQVKNLTTGEVRYFRGWDEMADIVPTMLANFDQSHHRPDGERPQDG